jgi:hypothetical protein
VDSNYTYGGWGADFRYRHVQPHFSTFQYHCRSVLKLAKAKGGKMAGIERGAPSALPRCCSQSRKFPDAPRRHTFAPRWEPVCRCAWVLLVGVSPFQYPQPAAPPSPSSSKKI